MWAMRFERPGLALSRHEFADPVPLPGQVRIRVGASGVCRTDLHIVDGELPPLRSPLTLGHEIVGTVERLGEGVSAFALGQRVGIGWLGSTCRACDYCLDHHENLCDAPQFTGYSRDGGFASAAVVDARYAYHLPDHGEDRDLAPLMCAGLIGWRSLLFAGSGQRLGIYGFGAAAHIVLQIAQWQEKRTFVFTRPDDVTSQAFARSLGADWVGGSDDLPPEALDAAIIYAPVGSLVPKALRAVRKGGRVVCAGIHMSDIPSFPYRELWGERQLLSVANLTRKDAMDFLKLAPMIGIRTHTVSYALADVNRALDDLRAGRFQGAAVLTP